MAWLPTLTVTRTCPDVNGGVPPKRLHVGVYACRYCGVIVRLGRTVHITIAHQKPAAIHFWVRSRGLHLWLPDFWRSELDRCDDRGRPG